MTEGPPLPFIVGSGRSGTTLLRLMLDGHPDMAIPPESRFPVELWAWRERYQRDEGFDLGLLAEDLLTNPRCGREFRDGWRVPPALVRERLHGVSPISYPEAMRRVYRMYADRRGKRRYGDKTPWFVLHLPLLAALFPEARFVHAIRDGRDVALSLLEMPWGPSSVTAAADWWRTWTRSGRTSGRALGPDRYLEVRYELLVESPEEALKTVCDFVELDYRPEMLAYRDRIERSLPPVERADHRSLSLPLTAGLRDWRRDMRPSDVAAFEAVAGRELEILGYPREVLGVPLGARVRAAAGVLGGRVGRAARAAELSARRMAGRARWYASVARRKWMDRTGPGGPA